MPGSEKFDTPICRNISEISAYIGVNPKLCHRLIKDHGLPAFKIDGVGNWKAIKSSLLKWYKDQERQHIK